MVYAHKNETIDVITSKRSSLHRAAAHSNSCRLAQHKRSSTTNCVSNQTAGSNQQLLGCTTRVLQYAVHNSSPTDHFITHTHQLHTLASCSFKTSFNSTLSSTPESSKRSLYVLHIFPPTHTCHMPCPSDSPTLQLGLALYPKLNVRKQRTTHWRCGAVTAGATASVCAKNKCEASQLSVGSRKVERTLCAKHAVTPCSTLCAKHAVTPCSTLCAKHAVTPCSTLCAKHAVTPCSHFGRSACLHDTATRYTCTYNT